MNKEEARAWLSLGIHPAWRKAEERLLGPLLQKFASEEGGRVRSNRADTQANGVPVLRLVDFIVREIQQQREELTRLKQRHTEFTQRYARAVNEDERRFNILEYAKSLGRSSRELAEDQRAFKRWFGMDAVVDRYLRRHTRCERTLSFCLGRLGAVAAEVIRQAGEGSDHAALWQKLDVERVVKPLLVHDGDSRVVIEAFRCLATSLRALPQSVQEHAVDEGTLQFIYRSALESRQQVWIQCEALSLLQSLSPPSFYKALQKRLSEPQEGDDLFLRRRAVLLMGQSFASLPGLVDLIPAVLTDSSAFVRQALPTALHGATDETVRRWLVPLGLQDASPQVRAACLLEFPRLLERHALFAAILDLMQTLLQQERDAFVLRVALKVMVDVFSALERSQPAQAKLWLEGLRPSLLILHRSAEKISVRRWAAQSSERLWCLSNPMARQLSEQLGAWLRAQKPGKRRNMPRKLLAGVAPELLGRVLSVLAQDDFGFDVSMGRWRTQVLRGHQFGMRLWRVLHEFRNPSPDKRQAFRHTIGRIFSGTLRAPSGILAELAETKVPGEPLFLSGESGWRPYLPLVDDMVSALDVPGGKVRLHSSEGVTEITAPRGLLTRFKARWSLSARFAQLARMRNWQEQSQASPASYVHALQALGFEVRYQPYRDDSGSAAEDPAVTRFFAAGLAMPCR